MVEAIENYAFMTFFSFEMMGDASSSSSFSLFVP